MQINHLDHVNIQTTQLDEMVNWYTDILNLVSGPRPAFPFPGAWLYAGDTVMVHLTARSDAPAVGSEVDLKLEHFAFRASGAAAFEARLKKAGLKYRRVEIAQINTAAFNVWDPDGNHIHVDFPLNEAPAP